MDASTTQQLQPETLTALENFITQWNNESIAQSYSLVITGNQVNILDNSILQIEETTQTQNNTEENIEPPLYAEFDPLDEFLSLTAINETNSSTTENLFILENTVVENNIEDTEQIISTFTNNESQNNKNFLVEFRQDLKEITNSLPISSKPLINTTWKNQMIEIISRLKKGTRGQNRVNQVRILEACYYLEEILKAHYENSDIINEINRLLENALGKRRAYNMTLTATRITRILEICGQEKLYTSQNITSSKITRLTKEHFNLLLEDLGFTE
jgi:hypothetical protein